MTVKMTIDDKEVRNTLHSMDINIRSFGRKIIKKYAELQVRYLKREVRSRLYVTGNLHKSIINKPIRGGWGQIILMADYAEHVDKGATPSRGGLLMPHHKASPYLKRYGIKDEVMWRRKIAKYGTRAHPFIDGAIYKTVTEAPDKIYKKYLGKIAKKR